jgi:hypothetical protein
VAVALEWLSKLAELGATAVVCVGLIYLLREQSKQHAKEIEKSNERYASVIENNTKAMTRMADSNDSLREVLDKQGVMLTQQNFLFQQMMLKKGSD